MQFGAPITHGYINETDDHILTKLEHLVTNPKCLTLAKYDMPLSAKTVSHHFHTHRMQEQFLAICSTPYAYTQSGWLWFHSEDLRI